MDMPASSRRSSYLILGFLAAIGIIAACANHPCRQIKRPDLANVTQPASSPTPAPLPGPAIPEGKGGSTVTPSKPIVDTVFVYKADGSLQCQQKKGASLEEMEKELAGIKVVSREKRPDGLMHIQVCGSPTGLINIYEIPADRLKDAEGRGFKKWERQSP